MPSDLGTPHRLRLAWARQAGMSVGWGRCLVPSAAEDCSVGSMQHVAVTQHRLELPAHRLLRGPRPWAGMLMSWGICPWCSSTLAAARVTCKTAVYFVGQGRCGTRCTCCVK
jgi:hypothetical protein